MSNFLILVSLCYWVYKDNATLDVDWDSTSQSGCPVPTQNTIGHISSWSVTIGCNFYCNNFKFLDRQVWANRVDLNQTAPGAVSGWLGWAMALGSFQCQGVLLLLHIVGQGPAVLATGAGRVGYIFYIFHLSSLSNVLSFGRLLNMTEILCFRLLNPNGSCRLLPRTSSLSIG